MVPFGGIRNGPVVKGRGVIGIESCRRGQIRDGAVKLLQEMVSKRSAIQDFWIRGSNFKQLCVVGNRAVVVLPFEVGIAAAGECDTIGGVEPDRLSVVGYGSAVI